eukprot:345921_1
MYSPHETNQNAYNALRSISLLQRAQMDNKYNNEIQSLIQHGLSQEHKNEEISRQNNFIPFRKPPYYSPNIPFRESPEDSKHQNQSHNDENTLDETPNTLEKSPNIPFRESPEDSKHQNQSHNDENTLDETPNTLEKSPNIPFRE